MFELNSVKLSLSLDAFLNIDTLVPIKKMSKPDIIIISPYLSDPRIHGRVNAMVEMGYNVHVYATDRGVNSINTFPENIKVTFVGFVQNQKYIQRIPIVFKIGQVIKKDLTSVSNNTIFYCFGLDSALAGLLAKRKQDKFIYEISDFVFTSSDSGIFPAMACQLENYVIRKTDLLVLTSEGFKKELKYRNLSVSSEIVCLENKLPDTKLFKETRPKKKISKDKISVSFIGTVRHTNMMTKLIKELSRYPKQIEFNIFGSGHEVNQAKQLSEMYENVFYHGSFKYPENLHEMYAKTDFIFLVYDTTIPNVRLLTPHKLFEAIYFSAPPIVPANTFMAEIVNRLSIGFVIDCDDKNWPKKLVDLLLKTDLSDLKNNCRKIKTDELLINHDHLEESMRRLLTSN